MEDVNISDEINEDPFYLNLLKPTWININYANTDDRRHVQIFQTLLSWFLA